MRRLIAGFTMVEVLVAVLLLAVGLVGALAMQAHAMRTRQDSALLTEALQAASALAERMRANGAQAAGYVGFEFDAVHDAGGGDGAHGCSGEPCDAVALAQRELEEFRQQLQGLPSARAVICRDASASAGGGPLQWACSGGADAPVVIKVGWRSRGAASPATAANASAEGPALALPVALPALPSPPPPGPAPAPAPAPRVRASQPRVGMRANAAGCRHPRSRVLSARQQGLAVAELMIAMTLSLLVALAAASLHQAVDGDFLHNAANTRIDDSGRFALAIITQSLRQAGFPGEPGEAAAAGAPLAVEGRDAASVAKEAEGMGDALPAVNASDVLAIRYAPAAAGAAGGAMLNCAGFPADPGEWAWSIFYSAQASDGIAELRCKYKGNHSWGADAVIRGVDAFHVLYGIDTDTPRDNIPNLYLTASAINARDAALPPDEQAQKPNWRRVVSVRIGLLLHGEPGSRHAGQPGSYALLPGADPEARIDEAYLPEPMRHRARRLFSATVALRNL